MKPTGNLIQTATPSPESRGLSTPKLPRTSSNFASTGAAPNLPSPSRQIGTKPTETTSAITPRKSLPAALEQANPDNTDRALEASLTSLLGSRPVPKWEDKISEGGWDGVVTGFALPTMTEETRARAIATVRHSLTPMTQSECLGLLGELKLLTKCRPEHTYDLEAQIAIYERRLQEYPADVVRKVLTTQPNMGIFWPAWAELKERLDVHSARRRVLLSTLTDIPKTSPPRSAATPQLSTEDKELQARAQQILEARRNAKAAGVPEMTQAEHDEHRRHLMEQCGE